MKTINLSELKNQQDEIYSSTLGLANVQRIYYEMTHKLKGRKPIWYYKGKKIIIDVDKNDIEEIVYCQHCGFQDISKEEYEYIDVCPICGYKQDFGWIGYKIKGTEHQIFSEEEWKLISDECKKNFTQLKRFKNGDNEDV